MTKRRTTPPSETPVRFVSAGVIAGRLGEPLHRVTNILATRKHIRPRGLGGTIRLYHPDAIAQVRHELAAIDARRRNRQGVSDGPH